jgi:hypothetical protein
MQVNFFLLFGGVVVVEFGCRRGRMKFTDITPITPLQPSQFQQHDDRLLFTSSNTVVDASLFLFADEGDTAMDEAECGRRGIRATPAGTIFRSRCQFRRTSERATRFDNSNAASFDG